MNYSGGSLGRAFEFGLSPCLGSSILLGFQVSACYKEGVEEGSWKAEAPAHSTAPPFTSWLIREQKTRRGEWQLRQGDCLMRILILIFVLFCFRWMWRSRTSVPKDYSAARSHSGRTTPELLLKVFVFLTLFGVWTYFSYFYFGVLGAMLLLVP